ncbi:hypothetical protein JCGZ_19655 [Jatropha curcas]|uniref:Uncharacterized protein n=1 Tax=Jatropha curcas TaxID=180498 RepID=A0A067JYB3_JATCU|nr:hypothetical protein JCGZ_19655 [Jatropha curcas]
MDVQPEIRLYYTRDLGVRATPEQPCLGPGYRSCLEGSTAIDHLATFVPGAYSVFVQMQLLVHVSPPPEFDPFAEAEKLDGAQGAALVQQQRGKHVKRVSDSRAPDTAVVIGVEGQTRCPFLHYSRPHGSGCAGYAGDTSRELVSDVSTWLYPCVLALRSGTSQRASIVPPTSRGRGTSAMRVLVEELNTDRLSLKRPKSLADWGLLTPFKLNGLSYYQNIRVQPGLLQWLINHFDSSQNLFRHNDFEIYPLFEEFSIISGRMLVVEEVLAVPRVTPTDQYRRTRRRMPQSVPEHRLMSLIKARSQIRSG